DGAQMVAVVLQVAEDEVFGRFPAQLPGGGRGDGAGIDGVEIAARRQHVEPAARGGAGGAGGDEFAVETIEQRGHLGGAGGGEARLDEGLYRVEHGGGGDPGWIGHAGAGDEVGGEGFEVFEEVAQRAGGTPTLIPSPQGGGR